MSGYMDWLILHLKWDARGLKNRFGYTTVYPAANEAGSIRTEL
jgi:hypothetical protein